VIVRFQIDGASQAAIAAELGRTSEAVRKLIARARCRGSPPRSRPAALSRR